MKQHLLGLGGICASAAIALVAMEPVLAQAQVTGVSVTPTNSGMTLILETESGDRPQIFVVEQENELVADLIDTRLRLAEEGGFRQDNPSPGIASVVVMPLDSNSTRIVVTGQTGAPSGEVLQQDPRGIVFNYQAPPGNYAAPPPPAPTPLTPSPVAQTPADRPPQAQVPQRPNPDVLVPNPNIIIEGTPTAAPINPVPPMQSNSTPPPVGPLAISTIDPSASVIDMGTAERVPRLVLKDAPVEDVLALLARAAGLNLAFFEAGGGGEGEEALLPLTISLDVENESVQDVFNNVLRLTGLEANKEGTTIVVGRDLPDAARNVVSRTLRLNQVPLLVARDFLVSQGAETVEVQTRTQIQSQSLGPNTDPIVSQTTQTQVELLAIDTTEEPYEGFAPLPLRGLLFSVATRGTGEIEVGNELTLVGDPRQVEVATALLTQLETRRPQVAVNVKIVDVNLLNDNTFNSSFSFGIGDTFVSVDGGNAVVNFGGTNPPNAATTRTSLFDGRPVIQNPFSGNDPFLDVTGINLSPGTTFIDPDGNITRIDGGTVFPSGTSPVSEDPFDAGVSGVTLPTNDIITQERNDDGTITTTVTEGTPGALEFSLPSLFEFPTRFLSTLQAQVVSGNAKILTDPTLVIQEGQRANVNLTQQVVQRINVEFIDTDAGTRESREVEFADVGLQLAVSVQRIDDNGFVTVDVEPTVSSPVQTVDLGDDTGEVTLVQSRSVDSGSIRMRDGQTLILSGIIQDSDRTTVSKVPILGDIPLIGALFRNTSRENTRSEVIVLLTPNIIRDTEFSTFGYGYTPGPEIQEVLQRNGQNYLSPTAPR
ncbi:MAG: AMIN domain-containing protein [Cyanobacteriota bacterium]|nr:AMIN domain-containing protein [Cyanobacteriota bacterium]